MLKRFIDNINHHHLFQTKDKLLLAVSGGVDSVVLCELCKQSGYNFIIAHCNFQLRAEESERDERFVKKMGDKYGVPVLVKRFNTSEYAELNKVSTQVAARELRYKWFDELLKEHSLHHLLTAHHLDDNIETVLMNFFKGTGITGLRGMLPKQGNIIRPLLFARKEELLVFATESKLDWVEDSSNELDKYSRNYFRNQLIPLVEKVFPGAMNNLAHNLQRFSQTEQLYKQAIDIHKKKLIEKKGNEFHIPVLKLQKTEPLQTVLYEILKEFNFSPQQTGEAFALLESESGKYVSSSTHRIIRNRAWLIIAPNETTEAENILIEEKDKIVRSELFELWLLTHFINPTSNLPAGRPPTSNQTAYIDSSRLKYPLLLRKWKTGDYFYPLGMKKKKKLSRFLIDQKLSKTDKEKIWVIESDKRIVWVIGHRIDDRFKITDHTTQLTRFELRPAE